MPGQNFNTASAQPEFSVVIDKTYGFPPEQANANANAPTKRNPQALLQELTSNSQTSSSGPKPVADRPAYTIIYI